MSIPAEIAEAPVVHDLYGHALRECVRGGLYMEFGVGTGKSLRSLQRLIGPGTALYGFDSFLGLPEAWEGFPVGSFATGTFRPKINGVTLVEGLFEDTVPRFAEEHPYYVSFMHFDCDLYSSTKTVLEAFSDQVVDGTVMVFDDYFSYTDNAERRAFLEWSTDRKWTWRCIGRWNHYRAAFKMIGRAR